MSRWEGNTRVRLLDAALDLFGEREYDSVTVAEIAERAGLTKRTFFRHFSDKREVLFGGGEAFQAQVVTAVAGAREDATPLEAVALSVHAAGAMLGERHAFARERSAVIAANR